MDLVLKPLQEKKETTRSRRRQRRQHVRSEHGCRLRGHQDCSGGYSQGAAVVDIITVAEQPTLGFADPMPTNIADHVAAVAVFGNPSNRILGGPLTALSPLYGYKTIDLCNGADPVCSDGNDVPAHSLYVEAGLATQAAQFVADRLTTQAPISTLAGQGQG